MSKAPYVAPRVLKATSIQADPKITFPPVFTGGALLGCLSAIHTVVKKHGNRDVILDFSRCTHVLESGMLPLIPILNKHAAKNKAKFDLILPKDEKIASQFRKCNWAHLIDPLHYVADNATTITHCPALRYRSAEEQSKCVDKILSVIMASGALSRDALKAVEWSLNEITDNVLNHSKSGAGYVQATWFRENGLIEFVVADAGIGIPASLGESDQRVALERAIQEGVTRNKKTNQGNGLYGSYRIASVAKGQFAIQSKFANLSVDQNGSVRIRKQSIPYEGTTVRWNIRTDATDILKKALIFQGRAHEPSFDFIDKITMEESVPATIDLKNKFESFGSRDAGKIVRNFAKNILNMSSSSAVSMDFDGINIVSSSFADEVFGRLFVELGPIGFMARIKITNADQDILRVIDRAIIQRSAQAG